jgi:hypothetical protein
MGSVADRLHREDREALRALTPAQRVTLALALGERDLAIFRGARRPPPTREEAARLLRQRRQVGRRPSPCHEALET